MLTKRSNKLFFTLAAMLSLFVTAVSACACAHHQPEQKAEKASCHSAAHEQAATETADPSIPENFGAGCNCFVKNTPPAVTAKSEVKKSSFTDSMAALAESGPVVLTEFTSQNRVPGPETTTASFAGRNLTAGPSRAPPRL